MSEGNLEPNSEPSEQEESSLRQNIETISRLNTEFSLKVYSKIQALLNSQNFVLQQLGLALDSESLENTDIFKELDLEKIYEGFTTQILSSLKSLVSSSVLSLCSNFDQLEGVGDNLLISSIQFSKRELKTNFDKTELIESIHKRLDFEPLKSKGIEGDFKRFDTEQNADVSLSKIDLQDLAGLQEGQFSCLKLQKIEEGIKTILEKMDSDNFKEGGSTDKLDGFGDLIKENYESLTLGQDRSRATVLMHLNRIESVLNLVSEKVLSINTNVQLISEEQVKESKNIEALKTLKPTALTSNISQNVNLDRVQQQIEASMSEVLDVTTNKLIDAFELKLADFLIQNGLNEAQKPLAGVMSDNTSFKRQSFDLRNVQIEQSAEMEGEQVTKKKQHTQQQQQVLYSPRKARNSEGRQSENTPENLGQSIQNRINSKKIMNLGSRNSRNGSNPNSKNCSSGAKKQIKSEYRASDTLQEQPGNATRLDSKPIRSTTNLNQNQTKVRQKKRSSPRKQSSRPKIPNVRHSPNKRRGNKSLIDDLIASHKATTKRMESLNLTNSIQKIAEHVDNLGGQNSSKDVIKVQKFDSQEAEEVKKVDLGGEKGKNIYQSLEIKEREIEQVETVETDEIIQDPRQLLAPSRRSNSPKQANSRNSSNGKSTRSKISSKTIVSTYVDGNEYFNFQKCKWDTNAGSKNLIPHVLTLTPVDQLISMVDKEQAIMCQSAGYVYALKNGELTEEQLQDEHFVGKVEEVNTVLQSSKCPLKFKAFWSN